MSKHEIGDFVNGAYLDQLTRIVYVAEDADGICRLPTFSKEELLERGIHAIEEEMRTAYRWVEKLGVVTGSFDDTGRVSFQGDELCQLTLRSSRKLVRVEGTDELEFKAVSWDAGLVC